MGKENKPRHGSMAVRPRKRASSQVSRVVSWPIVAEKGLLGFAGYKAGMTHLTMIDDSVGSPTKGQEIAVPVTVVEAPPLLVLAARAYQKTPYGVKCSGQLFAPKMDEDVRKQLRLPKKPSFDEKKIESASDVRILAVTQALKTGFGKKRYELMEIALGGKDAKEKWEYAKGILGKEVAAKDVFKDGEFVDAIAVTKGKGWQGAVKRFGISMQRRKATGKVRHVGTLGPWHPAHVMYTVPMAGQMGYHKRTEHNKRILKIGAATDKVTPAGGFGNYGIVKNDFMLVKGSLAGPEKRLIRFRKSVASSFAKPGVPQIKFISLASSQGR